MITLLLAGILLFDTPVPSPTPSPTYPPANQPVSSFYIPSEPPPWPVPILPTWGTGTPQPTLYAATAAHGTDYPERQQTATAQLGDFTKPIHDVQTPVYGFLAVAPTASGTDVSSGIDPVGAGTVTFSGFATTLGDDIGALVGVVKAIWAGFSNMATGFPLITPILAIFFIALVIGAILRGSATVVKVGIGVLNVTQKVLTVAGVWIRG